MNDQNERGDRNTLGGPGEPGDDEIDLRVDHPADALSALLDGELGDDDEAAVRRHLEGCEPCRVELDDVAAARRALRSLPTMTAPPGFVGQLVDQRRRADRRGAAVTLLAAALALVIGVVAAVADDAGTPAGSGGDAEQVALVDRSVRLFPPTPSEASLGAGHPRWDAGRPNPDARLSPPARSDPSEGDDEESALDLAHEAGREMLDLMGG